MASWPAIPVFSCVLIRSCYNKIGAVIFSEDSSHFRNGLLPGGTLRVLQRGRGVKGVDEDANKDENKEGNKRDK